MPCWRFGDIAETFGLKELATRTAVVGQSGYNDVWACWTFGGVTCHKQGFTSPGTNIQLEGQVRRHGHVIYLHIFYRLHSLRRATSSTALIPLASDKGDKAR